MYIDQMNDYQDKIWSNNTQNALNPRNVQNEFDKYLGEMNPKFRQFEGETMVM